MLVQNVTAAMPLLRRGAGAGTGSGSREGAGRVPEPAGSWSAQFDFGIVGGAIGVVR